MSKILKELSTWGNNSVFQYNITISGETEIRYGKDFKHSETISAENFRKLTANFKGESVNVGTSINNPPEGSLGKWLKDEQITQTGIMSYLAPILIEEGYAERVEDSASIKIL